MGVPVAWDRNDNTRNIEFCRIHIIRIFPQGNYSGWIDIVWTLTPVETEDAEKEYGVKIIREFDKIEDKKYDAVVLCVAHSEFKGIDLKSITYENSTIYDVKSAFDRNIVTQRL